ncbi:RNA exonuclease 1 homolog isoform X2 [Xenopus laevis]|uniref:RNA exonuclease 1 homolog isoform X2 n=1 Tax=Xenopus laevis TaxID=8355 RepID=A0A8J0UV17_XENLA|nr:RNA exonuclease 1 homolog isoform X2 [Xenopus laevis]
MLKNTGYFRGLECPFRECCRRPYCHFRHRGRAAGNVFTEEAQVGAEYDPYSPELSTVPSSANDEVLGAISDPRLDILELERVNKAIEAVKSEVEREQRKYKELLETNKEYNASPSFPSETDAYSPMEYNPGSCRNGTTDYNPTPLSKPDKVFCKYTLNDSGEGNSKGRFMEYVPTAVAPVSKYKTNKYVIDNSKPPTDLEYDPMSNYSARLLSKEREHKGTKRCRLENQEEMYSPTVKKVCSKVSENVVEAQFSDSDEENESQYSPIQDRKRTSKMKEEVLPIERAIKAGEKNRSSGEMKEMAVQYNMEDIDQLVNTIQSKVSFVSKSGSAKEEKKGKVHNFVKKKTDTDTGINKADKEPVPPKQKTETRKTEKVKSKNHKTDKNISVKPSVDSNKKKLEKKFSKEKPVKFEKDAKGDVKNGKYNTKVTKSETAEKSKTSKGLLKAKSKQRSLSHVDLFGDESSEEDIKEKKKRSRDSRAGSNKGGHRDTEEHCSMQNSKVLQRPSTSSEDEIDYSLVEKEADSDSDPMEECLRVFYESQDVKTEDKGRMANQPQVQSKISEETFTTLFPGQKRRISHVTNPPNEEVPSKPVSLSCRRPTPQEMCYLRIQRAQEQAMQLLAQQEVKKLTSIAPKTSLSQPGAKKRIAHVPGLPSPNNQAISPEIKDTASIGMVSSPSGLSSAVKTRTLSGMASKTTTTLVQKRQAHAPSLQSATLKRPVIPTEFGAKVPTTIRQRYLNLFIDECIKLCVSQQEAFDKALFEEKGVYSRSTSRNIYLNVAVNTLKKLRNQGPSNKASSSKSMNKKAVSHESILGGKLAAKNSFSVKSNSGHREEKFSDAVLYTKLKEYMLTEEQMQEHGYPMAHPDKAGKAMIFNTEEKRSLDSSCRVCCRCGAEYSVSTSGKCVRREECIYHWGRLRRQRGAV